MGIETRKIKSSVLPMASVPTNLADLIAPFAEDAFLDLLRKRQLIHLRSTGQRRFADVIGWDALIGLLERGEYPRGLSDVRLVRESKNVYADRWLTRNEQENRNRVDLAKVNGFMAQGFNLVINPIDPYVPELAALCESLRIQASEQTKVGVVVTTGTEGAFKLHYDPEDLLIVQVEGAKRWLIYGPPVLDPTIEMPRPESPAEENPIFDEILEPGDFLYVPAGNWHHCQNKSERSVHLGVFLIPPTPWHAVNVVVRQALLDAKFRKPLTRIESPSQLAELEVEIKRKIVEQIGRMNLTDFPALWSRKRNRP